jgi:subtilisin-like proprotein convertase family protein
MQMPESWKVQRDRRCRADPRKQRARASSSFLLEACESRLLLSGLSLKSGGRVNLAAKHGDFAKADPSLAALYAKATAKQPKTRAPVAAPKTSPDPRLRMRDNRVAVEVLAGSAPRTLERDLKRLGMRDPVRSGDRISGWLPATSLKAAAKLPNLRQLRPTTMVTHAGAITSQGDDALLAAYSRNAFGVDGTGVKVGVISDSFDALGGYATDQTEGELPANVTVLHDADAGDGTDEGRAILQIVHDLAPGASLMFHDVGAGETSFAAAVDALVAAGADVIVDDVIFLSEPMFQDGSVAQALDRAKAAGVAYFSAAGNSGRNSWQGAFVSSDQELDLDGTYGGYMHDFDPGPAFDGRQTITVPEGQTVRIAFQWAAPFRSVSAKSTGSQSDIDMYLLNAGGEEILAEGIDDNLTDDPYEILAFENPAGSGETQFDLVITNFDGPNPHLMKYVVFGEPGVSIDEYATSSGTLFGHANASGAAAVGAAAWFETPQFGHAPAEVEEYSSAGGTPILFGPTGNRLRKARSRPGPRFVAADGGNTSFFGTDSPADDDASPNFFGTSAAAPHAAAVAALMLQANSAATPDRIYSALADSTLDVGDAAGGAGLISADRAISAIRKATLAGTAYDDKNASGSRDPDENALSDWGVFLDLDADGQRGAVPGTQTFTASPAQTIPADGTPLVSTLPIFNLVGDIANVELTVNIDHGFPQTVDTFVVSPRGTTVTAAELASLNGEDANGTWRLIVVDDSGTAFPGQLLNWSLAITLAEPERTTDAQGRYAFNQLPTGAYSLRQIPRDPGWIATNPLANPTTVSVADDNAVTLDLGSRRPTGEIRGVKFNDLDGDGTRDPGEGGLADWTIYLDSNHNGKLDPAEKSTTTAADGSYVFAGVHPGNYLVAEVPKPGWKQTGANVAGPAAGAPLPIQSAASHYAAGPHRLHPRSLPNDPRFPDQWHLVNTGQSGGTTGEDAGVTSVWEQNVLGSGVTVAIVDDGVDHTHPDLWGNYDFVNSYDFNGSDADAGPGEFDDHGTAVAGIVGALGNNAVGVSGVAPLAKLASLRLIGDITTDAIEAAALAYRNQQIHIYSNSWGPFDDGASLEGPGPLTLDALRQGVDTGRGGLGSIYVWAAGNGHVVTDNVNYDGYANSRYTIAVTAIGHDGFQAPYAEPGAPILVSAHSDNTEFSSAAFASSITTTDRVGESGYEEGDYTDSFGGTSAATPLVSGVVALMLQANPNLTWRDVQHVLVQSARQNDPLDGDWVANGAGRPVNHRYGFGAVNAAAAVALASNWTSVAPETAATSGEIPVGQAIPDGDASGISSSVTINDLMKVESVGVVFDADHSYRGDLSVVLVSPDGTESVLAEAHNDDGDDYNKWTFTSTHHWDEIAKGTWTLKVTDPRGGDAGTWNSWKLNLYGTRVSGVQYASIAEGQTADNLDFASQSIANPKVIKSEFKYATAPHRVVLEFDQPPAAAPLAADLEVKNLTTGQTIPSDQLAIDFDPITRLATWTFPGVPGGVLPDGNYLTTFKGLPDTHAFKFFHLTGDLDHDLDVDHADFMTLYQHFGQPGDFAAGDLDYSGTVDFNDFQRLEVSFGKRLEQPAEASSFEVQTTAKPAPKPVFASKRITARRRV